MTTSFPSSDPSVTLEGRVFNAVAEAPKGLAIIAHPYGTLGGSLRDPVVSSLAHLFAELGYRAVRFNARGVGASGGKGTWTGEGEAADYQAVAGHCIKEFVKDYPMATSSRLILAGYSAGSIYASAVRCEDLPSQFGPTVSYLLIAYPLDKLWALSVFGGRKWRQRVEELATGSQQRLLLVQGTQDQFTKSASYRAWLEQLKTLVAPDPAALQATTVEGADHFWRDEAALRSLIKAVRAWTDTEPVTSHGHTC